MTVRQQKTTKTLLEAMPYIRRFWGTTVVIKYGGAAMTSPRLKEQVAEDVVLLRLVGMKPVVVHGGGHRVTDAAAADVASMALVGKINQDIVALIDRHGGSAVGLSGEDGRLIEAVAREQVDEDGRPLDLGYVGDVARVNVEVLDLLAAEVIPVVASVGADASGQAYNIDADTVAGELAAALKAEKILFLSDVEGIYEDQGREEAPISECDLTYLGALQAAGRITGGMVPKVAAVRRALEAGVKSAHIVDGRVEHAALLEVLTDAGCGTKVTA
jgi:acetylglutamate kinase